MSGLGGRARFQPTEGIPMKGPSAIDGSGQGLSQSPEVLALRAKEAAAMFGVSKRTWDRWKSAGKCPPWFVLGGMHLWRIADLQAWVAAGFPDRATFEAQRRGVEVSVLA